jgi:hypothetical protein
MIMIEASLSMASFMRRLWEKQIFWRESKYVN